MEITLDAIISLAGLLLGSGGGAFFTWRYMRQKAKAEAVEAETEAKSAEVEMAQKVQDTYQEMLEDKKKEVEDNQRLIAELREDRDHYKQEYIGFRDQLDKLSKDFRDFRVETEEDRMRMKRDIARNARMVECMRPLLCGMEGCAIRVPVTISAAGEVKKKDVEPYNELEK